MLQTLVKTNKKTVFLFSKEKFMHTADLGIKQTFTYATVCLLVYDRVAVALPKGTNQNLSMRSLQIQWHQEIVKVQLYSPI